MRAVSTSKWRSSVFAGQCVLLAVTTAAASRPVRAEGLSSKKPLQLYVHDALSQAAIDLGLDVESKRLFEEEAFLDANAFVLNYRETGEGTVVQVDREKLKNFLKFSGVRYNHGAGPAVSQGSASAVARSSLPRACVIVRAEESCEACNALKKATIAGLASRIEKRGFSAFTQAGEILLVGDSGFEQALVKSGDLECNATVFAELLPERGPDADEEDSAEQMVRFNGYFGARDLVGRKVKARAQSSAQVAKAALARSGSAGAESLTRQYSSLLVNRALVDLYATSAAQTASQAQARQIVSGAADGEERYLRLVSVSSFATYSRFKNTVMASIPELKLEERIISPGSFQFKINSQVPLAGLSERLKTLGWNGQVLEVLGEGSEELTVRLR